MLLARRSTLASAVVFLIAAGMYARTIGFDYVWDDHRLVQDNPLVQGSEPWIAVWSSHFFAGSELKRHGRYYRPLVIASYRLNRQISAAPWGFHLVNVLLHALCSVLVLRLALLACVSLWASFAGALLFCSWSGHTEPVAWISGRTDLLLGCGVGLLLVATLGGRSDDRPRDRRYTFLAVTGAAIALLSKEPAIAVVTTLVLLALIGQPSLLARQRTALVVSLIVALAIALALRSHALANAPSSVQRADPSPLAMLAQLGAQITLLSGFDLRVFIQTPAGGMHRAVAIATALVGVAAVIGVSVWSWRRRPFASALLLLFLAALAPVAFARGPALRYGYLPWLLLAPLLALAFDVLAQRLSKRIASILAGALVLCWIGLGQARMGAWRDGHRLFAIEAAQNPDNPDAQFIEGLALMSRGNEELAAKHFANIVADHPDHRPSLMGLAETSLRLKRYDAAERALRRSMDRQRPTTQQQVLLGRIRLARGDARRALAVFDRALKERPGAVDALSGAERAARALGQTELAKRYASALSRARRHGRDSNRRAR